MLKNLCNPIYFICITLIGLFQGCDNESKVANKLRLEAVNYFTGIGSEYNVKKGGELLEQAVRLGDPLAKMWLARCYFKGRNGFKNDADTAQVLATSVIGNIFEFAKKGRNQGEAQFLLADAYKTGLGVSENKQLALEYYNLSVTNKYPIASEHLGFFYYDGSLGTKDEITALKYLSEASQVGDVHAMSALASAYQKEKKHDLAKDLYQKAAEKGYPHAMNQLAAIYKNGVGMPKDFVQAEQWHRKAADLDDSEAMYYLGVMYYRGEGIQKSFTEAINWFEKAAGLGDGDAMNYLGVMHKNGEGVSKNLTEAEKFFKKAAALDNGYAMYNLGSMYYDGEGVSKNLAKAAQWYEKSANLGHQSAMFRLGYMLVNGEGVPKNQSKAAKWFMESAKLGNQYAMFNLGVMYYRGMGVVKNPSEAAKWYKEAAGLGHPNAMFSLGWLYYNGDGLVADMNKAVEWFEQSAKLGNVDAMYALGVCYQFGSGVSQNDKTAFDFYYSAAQKNHTNSMYQVGLKYVNGLGVYQNKYEGLKWLKKAADNGSAEAWEAYTQVTRPQRKEAFSSGSTPFTSNNYKNKQSDDGAKLLLGALAVAAVAYALFGGDDDSGTTQGSQTCSKCDGKGEIKCDDACHRWNNCSGHWDCEYKETFVSGLFDEGFYYKRCDRCGGSGKK